MAFHVRDPETDALVREYAEEKRVGITDAIKLAVIRAREADVQARAERLAKMQAVVDEVSTWPRTGLKADKAFFDSLNDE